MRRLARRLDHQRRPRAERGPQEQLCLNADTLCVDVAWLGSRSKQRIRVILDSLASLQVDNQIPDAISSVLFLGRAAKLKKKSRTRMEEATRRKLPWRRRCAWRAITRVQRWAVCSVEQPMLLPSASAALSRCASVARTMHGSMLGR